MTKQKDDLIEEAARLKAIYKQRKQLDPTLNQAKIAEVCDWAGQSVVSQYMTGKIPLNLTALLKFSKALQFKPTEVSERLLKVYPFEDLEVPSEASTMRTSTPYLSFGHSFGLHPVEVIDDDRPLGEDEVGLESLSEVERRDGRGTEVKSGGNGYRFPFSKQILALKNIKPEDARVLVVEGNSMDPVLRHGCIAVLHILPAPIEEGQIYALDHDGQIVVRLLFKLANHGLRLRCYNTNDYPDERLSADYIKDHIKVLGKVFWYGGLI